VDATRQIAAQTRQRLAGLTPDGATRWVSLHDSDARPIAKGRRGKPVEFGYKAQLVDTDDGIVVDHTVEPGNPSDAPRLAPAVEQIIKRTGRKPRTVTADRGYGEQSVENSLHPMGVRTVVIPARADPARPGKPRNAVGHSGDGEMANRKRRPHQHSQTRIRLGPHPHRQHRRCPHLDWTWRPGPPPRQDQRPDGLTPVHKINLELGATWRCIESVALRQVRVFQVEVTMRIRLMALGHQPVGAEKGGACLVL
jgi:transposase, IS5 family